MQISINGENHNIDPNTSLIQLLQQIDKLEQGVAVAINQNIVPRSQWAEQAIAEHDNIAIFKAIAGG